jgi:hypothetical protein
LSHVHRTVPQAVLKILGLGFLRYLRDGWNRFDALIVAASLISSFGNLNINVSVVRVFRVGRVFRLVNKMETLRLLFNTLVLSLPSLWNIGSLLFVLFFIFAVLGT